MSVIALASAKAAPGVTTSAVLLASTWPPGRRVALVEADADGGVLAPRYALSPHPGLVSLCAATRHDGDTASLWAHTQEAGAGLAVAPGPASACQARAALSSAAGITSVLRTADGDVLADCGRLSPGSPAEELAETSDLLLYVLRPRLDELHHVAPRLGPWSGGPIGLLLIGDSPYDAAEVAEALDADVYGVLPDDPATAAVIRDGRGSRRSAERSPLMRSAAEIGRGIRARLDTAGVGEMHGAT